MTNPASRAPTGEAYMSSTNTSIEGAARLGRLISHVSSNPVISHLMHGSYSFAVKVIDAIIENEEVNGYYVLDSEIMRPGLPGQKNPFYYVTRIGELTNDKMGVMLVIDVGVGSDLTIAIFDEKGSDVISVGYNLRYYPAVADPDGENSDEMINVIEAKIGTPIRSLINVFPVMQCAGALQMKETNYGIETVSRDFTEINRKLTDRDQRG